MPPLGPNDPRFLIDGSAVEGFDLHDTRQSVVPGELSSARVERFPGSRSSFVIKGRASHGLRIVRGVLRADTYDALYALIAQHQDLVDSSGLVSVTFHSTVWPACALIGFETTGEARTYSDDGESRKAQIPVQFTFRVLAD